MEEKQGKLLPFLYETAPGRFLLRGLTHPAISKIAGAFLDTRASTVLIRSYVRKYHIDLKSVNALWLQKAGVQHIDICEDCTCCRTDLYWSHRKTGLQRGEQAALIALREVTP